MGSVEYDTAEHDGQQAEWDRDAEAFKKDALDDLVWRVMENEEGRPFDLVDFLAEQDDLYELAASSMVQRGWTTFEDVIESRLRAKLEDSEAVQDKAEEMAREE